MSSGSRGLGARISGLFACHFLGFGFFLPFFPLVLQARGVEPAHIGYVLGGATILRILASPVLSSLSDRSGRRRRSIFLYSLFGGAALLVFLAADGMPLMALAVAVMTIFQAPIVPLSEAYALSAVKHHGLDYGRMRLWGSVAFVAGNLVGGWIVQVSQGVLIVVGMLVGKAATGLMAIALPNPSEPASASEHRDSSAVAEDKEKPRIFASPVFLAALLCLGLIEGSHAAYYGYSSLFFGRIGISDSLVGLLWAIGVIVEIGVFAVIGRASLHMSPLIMVQIGAGAALVRWTLFPLAENVWAMVPLQCLHGLTFAVAHFGAVRFVAGLVSEKWSATGQSFLASASGVLMAAGMAVSGPLYRLDPSYPFWLMAVCATVGSIGLIAMRGALVRQQQKYG
ncbi:MFS transporter [Roseibium sp.]|uniref:MFS transporter n=1 Tax=Roseibium sp. TaxID=1936156 RepID=UPI003A9831C9